MIRRLTIHVAEAVFIDKVQKNIGTKEAPVMKPKKKKCIQNTLSFKNVTQEDAKYIIQRVRKNHGVAVWEKGDRKGQEMIYKVH